jgi:hypothetical protein
MYVVTTVQKNKIKIKKKKRKKETLLANPLFMCRLLIGLVSKIQTVPGVSPRVPEFILPVMQSQFITCATVYSTLSSSPSMNAMYAVTRLLCGLLERCFGCSVLRLCLDIDHGTFHLLRKFILPARHLKAVLKPRLPAALSDSQSASSDLKKKIPSLHTSGKSPQKKKKRKIGVVLEQVDSILLLRAWKHC